MSAGFILYLLRRFVTVLFYLLLVSGSYLFVKDVVLWRGHIPENADKAYRLRLTPVLTRIDGVELKDQQSPIFYIQDSTIQYQRAERVYDIQLDLSSRVGIYTMSIQVFYFLLIIGILGVLMRILQLIKLQSPFSYTVVKWLRVLSLLFITTEVTGYIGRKIIESSIGDALIEPPGNILHVLLSTNLNGLIIGAIIWIIAVIFQRGIELQEENALTV